MIVALPVMPVIVGTSLSGNQDRRRAYVIVASLAISLFLFTFLLKVSSAFFGIPAVVWSVISWGIIFIFGIATFWPHTWEKVSNKLGIYSASQRALGKLYQKGGMGGAVLMGVALDLVFSSCSPTYALILATVLPISLVSGSIALLAYVLQLALFLLLIAIFGRKLISWLGLALNPDGKFKRSLGAISLLFGVLIITGLDKKIAVALVGYQLMDETKLSNFSYPKISSQRANLHEHLLVMGQKCLSKSLLMRPSWSV